MEEIPGEEGFPAYLDSSIKNVYERAGVLRCPDGSIGSLTMIGVEWCEARDVLEPLMETTGVILTVMGLALTLIGLGIGTGVVVVGMMGMIVGPAMVWYVWRYLQATSRSILFSSDGVTKSPLGTANDPRSWDGVWRRSHAQIASIEVEQLEPPKQDGSTGYTHGVRILMRDGYVAHVAKHLEPDQAHMVAVQMTNALIALRSSVGTTAGPRRGEGDVLIN